VILLIIVGVIIVLVLVVEDTYSQPPVRKQRPRPGKAKGRKRF
jgi:hypothetical protein